MLKARETRVEERKEEKRSEKRDRILRAAEAIFLDKGFHAASMNEIAEAANVSTPHLYNFYASKAALALAVQLKMGQETFDAQCLQEKRTRAASRFLIPAVLR